MSLWAWAQSTEWLICPCRNLSASSSFVSIPIKGEPLLLGDVLIVAYRRVQVTQRRVLFRCQFPTHAISGNEFQLAKSDLDEACNDAQCPKDFRVRFTFSASEPDGKSFTQSVLRPWVHELFLCVEAIYENYERTTQPALVRSDSYERFAALQTDEEPATEDDDRLPSSASNSVFDVVARVSKSDATLSNTENGNGGRVSDIDVVSFSIDAHDKRPVLTAQRPLPPPPPPEVPSKPLGYDKQFQETAKAQIGKSFFQKYGNT